MEEEIKIVNGIAHLRTKQLLKLWIINLKQYLKNFIVWYRMKNKLTPISVEKTIVPGINKENNKYMYIMQLTENCVEFTHFSVKNVSERIMAILKKKTNRR